jgi:hypothetical protein
MGPKTGWTFGANADMVDSRGSKPLPWRRLRSQIPGPGTQEVHDVIFYVDEAKQFTRGERMSRARGGIWSTRLGGVDTCGGVAGEERVQDESFRRVRLDAWRLEKSPARERG